MKRVPVAVMWAVCGVLLIALVCAFAGVFASPGNGAVEWALRLPKERERARIAGFTGTKRVAPKTYPATDAGVDWVLLDAEMRANAPDGKLPRINGLLYYANPRTRRKSKPEEARAVLRQYESFLPRSAVAARKPICVFPYRFAQGSEEGFHAASLLGSLRAVSVLECRERGDWTGAMRHAVAALEIARQLETQTDFYRSYIGYEIETVLLRVLCEGMTTGDSESRLAGTRAFATHRAVFLNAPHGEKFPARQVTAQVRDSYLFLQEILAEERAEKYDPNDYKLMESVPVLRLLTRLGFVLERKESADAYEATSARSFTGAATQLRLLQKETRLYPIWQALKREDVDIKRQLTETPDWLEPLELAPQLLWRMHCLTDRALTQAVFLQVSGGDLSQLPDDPFAPKAGTPIRRRNLAGGVTVWYSVGVNGVDDGGDFQKDRVVRMPALMKGAKR